MKIIAKKFGSRKNYITFANRNKTTVLFRNKKSRKNHKKIGGLKNVITFAAPFRTTVLSVIK